VSPPAPPVADCVSESEPVVDLPLLLVRDGTGKVTRIHVVER
jgi:hypothetical protein